MTETTQTAGNGGGKAVATRAPLETGGKIMAIVPQNMEAAFRLANAIAAAGVAPKSYNNDANKIMVGIMHGLEAGLPPMAALQSIAVINGMPTIWGDGALALVRASGLLESVSETIEGTGDTMRAVCTMRRRGEPDPIARAFSVGDAKQAGLWSKQGPWTQYPKRMLQMRARAWAMRDGFADVLKGLVPREEAHDMGVLVDGGDGTYTPPPRPKRENFETAGHADLDTEYREMLREPAPAHDPATGEIKIESAAPSAAPGHGTAEPAGNGTASDASTPGNGSTEAETVDQLEDWRAVLLDVQAQIAKFGKAAELVAWWNVDSYVADLKKHAPALYSEALATAQQRTKLVKE